LRLLRPPTREDDRFRGIGIRADAGPVTGDETPARLALRWSPLALALAVFLVWGARDGGYSTLQWLPGALFLVGLVVVLALSEGRPFEGRPLLATSAALFAAFTAWSFLSISWAGVKGDAWDGANRTLLYLAVFVLFACRPIPARVGAVLLGTFVAVTAAVGAADFARAVDAHRVEGFFIAGRLSTPISYPNANAALLLAPFAPAIFLASRRAVPLLVRAVMLASAGLLLELAIMCQSRATLVALPLAMLLYLAITPGRLRSLLALAAVATPAALGTRRLLHVYSAVVDDRGLQPALTQARSVLVWSAVALFLAGLAIALADRWVEPSERAVKALGALVAVAAAAAVVTGAVALVGRYGDPADRVATAWRDFKNDKTANAGTNHLISGFGSPRYDLWRVALHEFKGKPLVGVGVDNFAVDYLRLRRTQNEPVHPHSLELRVLAQTGIVGAILFAGFLGTALAAACRSLRQRRRFAAGVAATALTAFAYWFIHGSVDWFWEMPALGAPAIAWLAVAGQTVWREPPRPPRRLPYLVGVPLVLTAAVAAASLALPWVAAKDVQAAAGSWAADPAAAFRRLDAARRLNPLSDEPDLVAGVIASRLHDRQRERAAFTRVLRRNSVNWYARFELALLDAQAGKRAAALAQLRVVTRLNPQEPMVKLVRGRVVRGQRISQREIDRLFLERTRLLTGARQR
jgi:hypothetical protein